MGARPRKHNDPQPGSGAEYIDAPSVANPVLEESPGPRGASSFRVVCGCQLAIAEATVSDITLEDLLSEDRVFPPSD